MDSRNRRLIWLHKWADKKLYRRESREYAMKFPIGFPFTMILKELAMINCLENSYYQGVILPSSKANAIYPNTPSINISNDTDSLLVCNNLGSDGPKPIVGMPASII